jgi:arylsulfatase
VKSEPGKRAITLIVDGKAVGSGETDMGFHSFISWSGLDIGRDRGSPVGDYAAPFEFTGQLKKVTVTMDADQALDGDMVGEAEMARQ